MAENTHNALKRPLIPSTALAAVIGEGPVSRADATKRIWDYIKENNLQNPANRRNILADERLRALFGQPEVTMFQLTAILSKNLSAE